MQDKHMGGIVTFLVMLLLWQGDLENLWGSARGATAQTPEANTNTTITYKPPLRGAPGGRVSSGTRRDNNAFMLTVLAPDHTGFTTHAQPTLYWYIAHPTTLPVVLTITDLGTIQPLLEIRLAAPFAAGIHRFSLAEYNVSLEPERLYEWSVTILQSLKHQAQNTVTSGSIARVALAESPQTQLDQSSAAEAPRLYAQAGLWYDALAALSESITAVPHDTGLRQQRAALLEQIGLPAAAAFDRQAP